MSTSNDAHLPLKEVFLHHFQRKRTKYYQKRFSSSDPF